ncbi:hypothetical protein AVEN_37923-1, partial [Araneus ventricosus]
HEIKMCRREKNEGDRKKRRRDVLAPLAHFRIWWAISERVAKKIFDSAEGGNVVVSTSPKETLREIYVGKSPVTEIQNSFRAERLLR